MLAWFQKSKYKKAFPDKNLNLQEMDNFLGEHSLTKFTPFELNTPISIEVMKKVTKKLPPKKASGPSDFKGEFYQTVRDQLIPMPHKLFQRT